MTALTDYYDTKLTQITTLHRLGEASGDAVDYEGAKTPGVWSDSPLYSQENAYNPNGLDSDTCVHTNGQHFTVGGFTEAGPSSTGAISFCFKLDSNVDQGIYEWYLDTNNHLELWWDSANSRFQCDYTVAGSLYQAPSNAIDPVSEWVYCHILFSFYGIGSQGPNWYMKSQSGIEVTGTPGAQAPNFPNFPAGTATIKWGGCAGKANMSGYLDEAIVCGGNSLYTDRKKIWFLYMGSAYAALVLAKASSIWWRMNEPPGTGYVAALTSWQLYEAGSGTVYQNAAGPVVGDPGSEEVLFNGSGSFQSSSRVNWMGGASQLSIQWWCKFPADTNYMWTSYQSTSNWIGVEVRSATQLRFWYKVGGATVFSIDFSPASGDFSDWRLVTWSFDNGYVKIFVDNELVSDTGPYARTTLLNSTMDVDLGTYIGTSGNYAGSMADFSIFKDVLLQLADVEAMYSAARDQPSVNMPMRLMGFLTYPEASMRLRLIGAGLYTNGNMPMRLSGISDNEGAEVSLHWDVSVTIEGVDISSQLVGRVTIEHQEKSSGLATFQIIPGVGNIDPDSFERKQVKISYHRMTSVGAIVYSVPRFTGTSSSTYYDPDAGIVRIEATTDLQGQLEQMDRDAIDAIIPTGQWSEHIFDDSVDGWQYAQDVIATTPYDIFVNNSGQIVTAPWAAKTTADLEMTDDQLIDKPIALTRTKRRDIITRVRINLDFRFVRLRHRQIRVTLPESYSFCEWLNNGMQLPGKSMVQNAADSNSWTRVSPITFNTFPPPGTYCIPSRGWVGGADEFCLSAWWLAARRWAQTVTEENALIVHCPDIEESVGKQETNEDYGVKATYDSTDYERITEFSGPPSGSVFDAGNSEDWTKDATDAERDGRLAMEDAQRVVLAKASTTILDRARRNRLSFFPVFNPFITLDKTIRVNSSYVQAKGKVFRLNESFDVEGGDLEQQVSIAISRHGGSGLAVNEPQDPVPEPGPPTETPTPRSYYLPWRVGGVSSAQPVQDPDWDGMHTNVDPNIQAPGAPLYDIKLVVRMPEIEETARNATAVQAEQLYELVIPEDELTMSY